MGKQYCPAREATCCKCHKRGHFQSVCGTRSVKAVSTENPEDNFFVGVVEEPSPLVTITYKKKTVKKTVNQAVYVVKGLRKPLIGRPAITALKLVSHVNTVHSHQQKIVNKFPKLFRGLGTIEGEYEIVLTKDAKPYALVTPRRIPLSLKSQVEEELKRMEALGVIRKVDVPTDWCVRMVVVPKSKNKVRICVDLTKLNRSVCRERHILPSVEQILTQLKGAKIFSKLDANSGFWQIKLSSRSALLTTFITPMDRFCFNCLPFGKVQ